MSRDTAAITDVVSRRNVVKATGAALGVVTVTGTATAKQGGRANGSSEGPYSTAHRGYRDVFPQNTVAAVSGSAGLGAETPSEEVLEAEVLDSRETIPTLAETLAATRPPVTMNLEFKHRGPLSWAEFAERTLEIASRYPGDFYASSFDHDAIRAVREIDPSVGVAPIFGGNKDDNLAVARELDAEALNCSTGVLDRDLVETAHDEGRAVNVWTIDSWREAKTPIELGVDGLIADYPHMATFATD